MGWVTKTETLTVTEKSIESWEGKKMFSSIAATHYIQPFFLPVAGISRRYKKFLLVK